MPGFAGISTKWERRLRAVAYHVILAAGSFVFAIPFIWLLSTSCKVPDEMYPPRWIPQVPVGVVESPYIGIRPSDRPVKPFNVAEPDWRTLKPAILDAIGKEAVSLAEHFPAFYRPHLNAPELAEGVMGRLLRRAPDAVFTEGETVAAQWFVERTTPDMVAGVFETVYRRAAVSDVVLYGKDIVTVEQPTDGENTPWEVLEGDAELVPRPSGLLRRAKEVHYSFAETGRFALQADLDMEMAPENLRKVAVSIHGDRSWHSLHAIVEAGGRRYEAAQPAFFRSDRWQDTAWQVASEEDESIQIRNWIRLDPAGESDFDEPKKVRLTLVCDYQSRPMAALSKYVNNYRDVMRQVPLFSYIKNSVLLVGLNIAGQIMAASLVAFSFARLRWPARDFCFALVLATLMIPPQVTMIPVFLIYKNLGLYNTLTPLWLPAFFGSAFFIFLLRQFMRGIPTDLEDSAKIDGCGYFGIYWRVILPLIKPALATIGIFTFLTAWNDFMGPLIYLSDQELYPLSLGLFALHTFQNTNFGLMMAASVLMTVPIIVLFFVAQRHFIQGITLTGLKG